LTFELGRNQWASNSDGVIVRLGGLFTESFTAGPYNPPSFTVITRNFTVGSGTTATLEFEGTGSVNDYGAIIDDVSLVMEPFGAREHIADFTIKRDWQPNLEPNTTYYWRVRTLHAGLTGSNPNWFGPLGSQNAYASFTTSAQSAATPLTLDLSGDANAWSLVSTNLAPSQAWPRRLFGLGTIAWEWNALQQVYEQMRVVRPFVGFWLNRQQRDANFEVDGFTPLTTVVPIRVGWNLNGVLNNGTEIPTLVGDRHHIFGYLPDGSYDKVESLDAGRGYWIYSTRGAQVDVSESVDPN
jgi:hypothetical protein